MCSSGATSGDQAWPFRRYRLSMWRPASDLMTTALDSELVLLDARSGEMYSLNASGQLLWHALPAELAELIWLLRVQYDLDAAQAQADAQAWLSDLAARGLIELAPHE
jgi:Coenzyme PQQ synthesis protein D (PqqD)